MCVALVGGARLGGIDILHHHVHDDTSGTLVLTLQHDPSTNRTFVVPSLIYGDDNRFVIEVEEQLQYPPPGYTSGTEVW